MLAAVTINSYAGSLVHGLHDAGVPLALALEDEGYGGNALRANFPGLPYLPAEPWPDLDLSRAMIMAHPPCAGFSSQGKGAGTRDTRFQCVYRIMAYAQRCKAAAVAIESVPQAESAARMDHDALGQVCGYNVFRVRLNASGFSLPQDRPRFWVVYSRGCSLPVRYMAQKTALKSVRVGGQLLPAHARIWQRQVDMLRAASLSGILEGEHGFGPVGNIVQRVAGLRAMTEEQKGVVYSHRFRTNQIRVCDPEAAGPALTFTTLLATNGEPLSIEDYKAYMGFPRSYDLRGDANAMKLLTRGVCPPVAGWLGRQIAEPPEDPTDVCLPGQTLELR